MHWTQTKAGKKKMSEVQKARYARKRATPQVAECINESHSQSLDDAITFVKEQISEWESVLAKFQLVQKELCKES